MDYRKDIQILRGLAVIQVVLFHLRVPGFGSGFLGVDVFLVVSGYLMAVMYRPDAKRNFFEKRAKRLLPAYFVTVLVTLLAAALLSAPQYFQQVFDQVLFATLLSSNIGFWLQDSYFATDSFRPLLHLWSLGIELQFYLLVPGLYWVLKGCRACFWSIAILSVVACFAILQRSPESAFFLLPFRLWEFLLGFGLADVITRRQASPVGIRWAWGGAGALCLLAVVPVVPMAPEAGGFVRGHPGALALVVAVATFAVLFLGLPARLLANPLSEILEKTGRYSYSIYLAHFPIIVLALHRPSMVSPVQQLGILVAVIVVGSMLLYAGVERPFRKRRRAIPVIGLLAIVSLLSSQADSVLRSNLSDKELLIHQAQLDRGQFRCGKMFEVFSAYEQSCEITPGMESPVGRILFVGNSHADAIKAVISELATARNVSIFMTAQNDALIGKGLSPDQVLAEARRRRADMVVLHYSTHALDITVLDRMVALARREGMRISLLMPVPSWSESVPDAMRERLKSGRELPCQGMREYRTKNAPLLSYLERPGHEYLKVYPVTDAFLRNGCFMFSAAERPLYYDYGHLTLSGSWILQNVLARLLDDLQRPAPSVNE